MKEYNLVKRPDGWAAESNGRTVRGTKAPTKAQSLQQTRDIARKAPEPISLRIHKLTASSRRSARTRVPQTRGSSRG